MHTRICLQRPLNGLAAEKRLDERVVSSAAARALKGRLLGQVGQLTRSLRALPRESAGNAMPAGLHRLNTPSQSRGMTCLHVHGRYARSSASRCRRATTFAWPRWQVPMAHTSTGWLRFGFRTLTLQWGLRRRSGAEQQPRQVTHPASDREARDTETDEGRDIGRIQG